MANVLGYEPTRLNLILSAGADFVQNVVPGGGAVFATGTTASIKLFDATGALLDTWPATVTALSASWMVQSTSADPIPAGSSYRMIVSFPTTPTTEYCWYFGQVFRKQ